MPITAILQTNTIDMPYESRHRRRSTCTHLRVRSHHRPAVTVVTISGDLDASSVGQLSHQVRATLSYGSALILDFSRVDFVGVAGFNEILAIGDQCAEKNLPWTLVSSRAVQVMLRLGDPDRRLPAADSLAAALLRLDRAGLRRHVTQPVTPAHLTRC